MDFNVAQFLKEPIGATRQYTVAQSVHLLDDQQDSWIEGEVRLLRTDKGVLTLCSLEANAQCQCVRCLTAYPQPVRMVIEEEYLPTVDIATGARTAPPDRDAFMLDDRHILHLGEAVRQYLLLNLPMQPLCREGCLGICPHCGVDLNQQTCRCSQGLVDPRWTPLLELKASGE